MVAATLNERKDGIYPGMKRPEYERIEAVNYSTLKHFARTPAHAREEMLHPSAPTAAMELGTALHAALLEPARFATDYVASPKFDRRTKEGKEGWAAFEESNRGKEILGPDDLASVTEMQSAVYQHPVAKVLLSSPGKNECCVLWTDPVTGLRCKSLLDRITSFAGWTTVVDLKKCRDASHFGFSGQAARLLYHEQAAFYLWGLETLDRSATRRWMWICPEDERPYCVAVYEPDADTLEQGKRLFRAHLDTYAKCQRDNNWPGYPAAAESLRLPKWAMGDGNVI
jgi:exodeoxyribonuclease VIII